MGMATQLAVLLLVAAILGSAAPPPRKAPRIPSRDAKPSQSVRLCTWSDAAFRKCNALRRAAFPRASRPSLECVRESLLEDCTAAIAEGRADIATLDSGKVFNAQKKHNLKPILAETYGDGPLGASYFSVAVVRANSSIKSFADLKGKKSCHTGYGRTAGWNVPLHTLMAKGLVSKTHCPYTDSVAEFFSGGSCVPGVKKAFSTAPDSMCALCPEGCMDDSATDFSGYDGAFRCLVTGLGDVAFVRHTTVAENIDLMKSDSSSTSDYELLCPEGGRAPLTEYDHCNLAKVPPHMVVASSNKTDDEIADIHSTLQLISNMLLKKPQELQLFGPYNGIKDLLFKDNAKGLIPYDGAVAEIANDYQAILREVHQCDA